jgi:hypothetical protein
VPEYEVPNFCVFCNIGFFNSLRSDNLLLNVLRLVRIFNTMEYRKMTSEKVCLFMEVIF